MAKQPVKQLTLQIHSPEYPDVWVRTKEEGELLAYVENTGKQPNNLEKSHPAYKLWTYRTKRDGVVVDLIKEFNERT